MLGEAPEASWHHVEGSFFQGAAIMGQVGSGYVAYASEPSGAFLSSSRPCHMDLGNTCSPYTPL